MNNQGIKISSYDSGIHLDGSLLWFNAHKSGDVSFLSSPFNGTKPVSKNTQFIQTTGTAKILEALGRKHNSINCQFNRPFSVGSIKMELLPAGSMLGSSSIYLEAQGERLLYAPCAQPQKNLTNRKMQLKKADILLLEANIKNLKHSFPSRKKEKQRLLNDVLSYKNRNKLYPYITASGFGVAQEITYLLTENKIPVAVHPQIARVNKVYSDHGINLGDYSQFSKRTSKEKLIILPFSHTFSRPFNIPADRDVISVAHDQDSYDALEPYRDIIKTYILNTKADGPELKEIITAVQPNKLVVTGTHVQTYLNEFASLVKHIKPVYKNLQPSLFN